MEKLILGLEWYVVFLFSIVCHEAAHALAAMRLGDPTAYHGGQVTLDPVPHVRREPFGTVVVPIVSFVWGGWMIGWASAPYDPFWASRYPRRAALMALAGPAANLALLVAAGLMIRAGILLGVFYAPDSIRFTQLTAATEPGIASWAAVLLSILFTLNLVFIVFNLIPVPPLDGSGILPLFMSERAAERYRELLSTPMISIVGLLLAWRMFGSIFRPIHLLAVRMLYPELAYR